MLKSLLPCLHTTRQPWALLARSFTYTAANAARTHYEVLGLQRSATVEDIKNAFRQKAKELHPDLNAAYMTADGEAFLQLVTAYEVLSDAEQRRLYDISSSSQLPQALRHAAAAAAGSADSSPHSNQPNGTQDAFGWRYGLSDWAEYGPGSDAPAMADNANRLRWSLLSALARHRADLEHDLHAGLLKAFLGPKLEVAPGQLPPAFEADERAHPSVSHHLLHLVHGRTLLGVVQLQLPLQIAGNAAYAAEVLPASDTQQLTIAAGPDTLQADALLAQLQRGIAAAGNAVSPTSSAASTSAAAIGRQTVSSDTWDCAAATTLPHRKHPSDTSNAYSLPQLTGVSMCADDDAEITDPQWQQLLQKQHPLHGVYNWLTPVLRLAVVTPVAAQSECSHLGSVQGAGFQPAGSEDGCGGSSATSAATSLAGTHAMQQHRTLGGRAVKQAWEEAWQQQHGCSKPGVGPQSFNLGPVLEPKAADAFGTAGSSSTGTATAATGDVPKYRGTPEAVTGYAHQPSAPTASCVGQHCSAHDGTPLSEHRMKVETEAQQKKQQVDRAAAEAYGVCRGSQHQQRSQQQQQQQWGNGRGHQQQQRYKQQASWLRQRRLWRWVRSPTPDWSAADWQFDDRSEGVLVLQLLLAGGRIAAVAVRDDKQPAKPTKVYINGTFTVAVLDDIVMEPLTGRLMGVLYKYYTPGVHHLYYYLPGKQGSRVLARLQRRWMPPSGTWLFPPVSDSHDRGGWVVEWEGHAAESKPGWMHPAVFVLTAASYSYDMEVRRMQKGSMTEWKAQMWQLASNNGRRLLQALQRWRVKFSGQT